MIDSNAYVLLRTREDFGPPRDEDHPILILETLEKGKQAFNYFDGEREFHKLLQASDLYWNFPSEIILGDEKANHSEIGYVPFNYFDLLLSAHKGGCGFIALANGCDLDPFKIALDIAEDEKYAFLKPVLLNLSFYDKLDMVLPTACWLTTGMIAVWSRKKKIPVIIFKASTNRQGWVPSYVTDIGPVGPLTMIVCLRIDGSKFDSLKPVELEGAQTVREVYHQLHNIMPADVSAVDESVDSELDGLLDVGAHAETSQDDFREVISGSEAASDDSDGDTKDGAVSDASDSVPSLIERAGDSSDDKDTDDEVDDAEMQLDDRDVAADNIATEDGGDVRVDNIVNANSISSVSVSTDNSCGSTNYQAIMAKMKGSYNPRKVKVIILKVLSTS